MEEDLKWLVNNKEFSDIVLNVQGYNFLLW